MVKNLKKLRQEKKLSQQQLGEIIGFSQQSVHKYETQLIEPDISTLIKLADFFGTSVDNLIGHNCVSDDNNTNFEISDKEKDLIVQFRTLSAEERKSIELIINNYIKNK